MIIPQTIVSRVIETPVKAILARKLSEKGFSQPRIARILGVSQPTVNMYLRDPEYSEESILRRISKIGIDEREIVSLVDEVLELIISGDIIGGLRRITLYGNSLLADLKLCKYHRRIDPEIPESCNICSEMFRPHEDLEMIFELERFIQIISRFHGIHNLIPEVGMNIAYARRDARDLNDIIAYPGRIIKVNEAIIAVGKPSWGASRHLGSILLKIRVERPELRALASVRVHECLDRWMKNSDISLEISDDRDNIRESDIIERVSRAFTSSSKIYIVEDPGGRGFEPIVYIAGENPLRIALILEKILKTC